MNNYRVYFAHAKPDYNSQIEKEVIKMYGAFEGTVIVNPADPALCNSCIANSMSYWLGIVSSCTALTYIRYHGKITAGVGLEINHALERKMKVWEIRLWQGRNGISHERVWVENPVKYLSVAETKALFEKYNREPQTECLLRA